MDVIVAGVELEHLESVADPGFAGGGRIRTAPPG